MDNVASGKAAAGAVMSLIEVLIQQEAFTYSDFQKEINKLLEEKISEE